ncbi:hypothetical protein [Streptomyces sp. NPDC002851]
MDDRVTALEEWHQRWTGELDEREAQIERRSQAEVSAVRVALAEELAELCKSMEGQWKAPWRLLLGPALIALGVVLSSIGGLVAL